MHRKQIKQLKAKVNEQEDDKRFYEEQIEKTRYENKNIKEKLTEASAAYDKWFALVQRELEENGDKESMK